MKCIVCESDIMEVHMAGHIFYVGAVSHISPGYGSCHDLKKLKIGICDDCLTKAEKNDIIINKGEH